MLPPLFSQVSPLFFRPIETLNESPEDMPETFTPVLVYSIVRPAVPGVVAIILSLSKLGIVKVRTPSVETVVVASVATICAPEGLPGSIISVSAGSVSVTVGGVKGEPAVDQT